MSVKALRKRTAECEGFSALRNRRFAAPMLLLLTLLLMSMEEAMNAMANCELKLISRWKQVYSQG